MTPITLTDRDECPLCHTHEATVFIAFPEIPVVRCRNCGFTYSSKVISGKELSSYYENNYGSQRQMQGQLVNSIINSMVLERLLNFQDISSILDVGTGYGFLLQKLCKRHNLQATGMDLSRQEAEYARNILGVNVINSLLGNSGLSKGAYDLVTSFEVIEHVLYPTEFLLELTEYIKPGGYLLTMTDNFDSRMAKSLGAGFPKWIPHSHISHFSALTLRKALEETGKLEIVKSMSYTPWEILLRNVYYKARGITKTPSEAFDFASNMENEMKGTYRFFTLRKLFNKAFVKLTLSRKMDGDLMYFLCKRIA